jgi:hypothetical protein
MKFSKRAFDKMAELRELGVGRKGRKDLLRMSGCSDVFGAGAIYSIAVEGAWEKGLYGGNAVSYIFETIRDAHRGRWQNYLNNDSW